MKNILRPVLVIFAAMTVVTGLVYPVVVTAVAHAAFPSQSNGSLIEKNGKTVGSELIGQQFDAPLVFLGPALGDRAESVQTRRHREARTWARPTPRSPMKSKAASVRCTTPIRPTRHPFRSIW